MFGERISADVDGCGSPSEVSIDTLPSSSIKTSDSSTQVVSGDIVSYRPSCTKSDETATDSITEVAHYLGKEVIACSVDSAICFQRMKKLSLDYIQGSTVSDYDLLDIVIAPFNIEEDL